MLPVHPHLGSTTGQGDAQEALHPTAATFLYCVLGQSDMGGAADLGGFIAICGLRRLAIGYLAYN